ncbi:amidohydrolase [Halomicroarcula sp. GCM10025709]|uniref:amidohydrolase n=1 Tax=Haloarcula TaxID=2237 RepID=UPI0024C2BBD7|nr:amidohydrolase [Halomicroarcula sp. YJ-61-S]
MDSGSVHLSGGTVYSLDDALSASDSVTIRDGRVSALGETPEDGIRTLDLDGATVLPGFNDAHTHVLWMGLYEHESDLSGITSRAGALDALERNADGTPAGEWVLGFGYDDGPWDRGLDAAVLDGVTTAHPVAVQRVDGHSVALNTAALDRLDFDGVAGVEREDGKPTGIVVEAAAGRVQQAIYPDRERARTLLDAACRRALELGITSMQDMAGLVTPAGPGDPMHAAFHAAWRAGSLPVRIGYYVHVDRHDALTTLELAPGFGDERLRVLGIKLFSDGSIGSRTAKLSGTFAEDPDADGQFVVDRERLDAVFAAAARADQHLAVHAIGDAAIERVLDAYAAVADSYDTPPPHLRIEHAELATDDHLRRMADLSVLASMQPNFLQWAGPDGLYADRLGEQWQGRTNRFSTVLDRGIDLAFGSDTMPSGPLYGIHQAVTAPAPAQRLAVETAIRAYTQGGAVAEGAADWKGTLEPGMVGDAVVLDRDPFDEPTAIDEIDVLATVVDGTVAFRREGWPA